MTSKAAFSLIELIVVIAIMAVMAAVLAPALLGYVEKSRMQKDDSALNEVTNAIHLSLADAEVYDEVLKASVKDNYSCYCDGDTSTNIVSNKIVLNDNKYWLFNDNCRLLDETIYKPAGKMRGVTVTFKQDGSSTYILSNGIINQVGNDSTKKGDVAGKTLADSSFESLYNRLRSTIGDTLKVSSQTYRNSDYTIFILLGTTGGNEATKQDAIQVYGQFNGTNLNEVADASSIAGESQAGSPGFDVSSVSPELEDNTWELIQEAVAAGKAEEAGLKVGDTKTVKVNGVSYEAVLIGLDHDGENTATFLILGPVARREMNSTTTNIGGWEASEMREWLNSDFLNSLDNKEYIKPVTKITNNQNVNKVLTETTDSIFLLSATEMGILSDTGYIHDGIEGKIYQYFADGNVAAGTWLRTCPLHYELTFIVGYGNGEYTAANATADCAITPCFVIG